MLRNSNIRLASSNRIKIGFIIEDWPLPYFYASASVRLRVYDVIRFLKGYDDIIAELYKPWKKYDAVFFQKRDEKAFRTAEKLKSKGTKIILDINANIFDKSLYGLGFFKKFNDSYFENIIKFGNLADYIAVTSPYLKDISEKKFGNKVIFLPENISDLFFIEKKVVPKKRDVVRFIYVGYASKANQLYLIKDTLARLATKYNLEYIMICDRNPHIRIPGIQFKYIPFQYKVIQKQILLGDIFLAPRDMNDHYNLGHSFTKIGLPMSVGIPVIASPIPAYQQSPAILIDTFDTQWDNAIENLINNSYDYRNLSLAGIAFCKKNFSVATTRKKYIDFFSSIL